MDTLKTALSYAPLGVRDAANHALGDLLGGLVERPLEALEAHQTLLQQPAELKLLNLEGQRKKLEGAYNDALVFFSAIAGERGNGHQTHEQTAREWLLRWRGMC
jgi:hypothetical protein